MIKDVQGYLDERNKIIIEFISPRKEDKILVIGTGVFPKIEYILFHLYKCNNITSGDIDKRNIENGRKILPKLKFVYLDAQKRFPFKDNHFDKIIFTEVLEHLKDENAALSEIRRVLKKEGKLIMSVPKRRWFSIFSPIFWVQHEREYTESSINHILEKNGFRIEKKFVGGSAWDLANLWVHLIYKHIFRKLHVEPFFKTKIDAGFKSNFHGKGTDIVIRAEKRLSD